MNSSMGDLLRLAPRLGQNSAVLEEEAARRRDFSSWPIEIYPPIAFAKMASIAEAVGGGAGGGGGGGAAAKPRPKGKRGLKALQAELVRTKAVYGASAKVLARKPGGPLAAVVRTVPNPNDKWDVDKLKFKLCVDKKMADAAPGELPVHVEAPNAALPPMLTRRIAAEVEGHWKAGLRAGDGWQLADTLAWCEANFTKLLSLDSRLVECYAAGSERRFAIISAEAAAAVAESEAEKAREETDEERAARYAREDAERAEQRAYAEKLDAKREADAAAAAELKFRAGQRTRDLIESGKIEKREVQEKVVKLTRREKKGHRMAKTGARAHKAEGEGHSTKEEKKRRQKKNRDKRLGLT